MQQLTGEAARAIFPVKIDHRFGAMEPDLGAAGSPKGGIQPGVELVMDREEDNPIC